MAGFEAISEFSKEFLAQVTEVTSDTRQIHAHSGMVFVAVRGTQLDGHQFIDSAFQKGAAFVVGEEARLDSRYIQVKDSSLALAYLAAHVSGFPSHSMTCFGVTGTSGKTTTTYLMEAILKEAGHRVGVMGTVEFRAGDQIFPSTHTTPGAVELHALLKWMKDQGCTAVVMEVSSHALKQNRCAFVAFDGMVFNNLSPEHLDYHPDMEDYFSSKSKLFFEYFEYSLSVQKVPLLSVHLSPPWGNRLEQEWKARYGKSPNGLGNLFKTFGVDPRADQVGRAQLGIDSSFGIRGEIGGVTFESPLTGQFNAENIFAAISLLSRWLTRSILADEGSKAVDPRVQKWIAQGLLNSRVPGRLERVELKINGELPTGLPRIWVDYAHKPDALQKVLRSLLPLKQRGRLITVVGCGGDRDPFKRPIMGKIAVELSDWVWFTSDNPRREDPQKIIQDIVAGVSGYRNYSVELDRAKAIQMAIQQATAQDCILIAGKGHETYQLVADPHAPGKILKIEFDDRQVALKVLEQIR